MKSHHDRELGTNYQITMSLFSGPLLVTLYCHVSWNSEDGGQRSNISHTFFDLTRFKHLNAAFHLVMVRVRVVVRNKSLKANERQARCIAPSYCT